MNSKKIKNFLEGVMDKIYFIFGVFLYISVFAFANLVAYYLLAGMWKLFFGIFIL